MRVAGTKPSKNTSRKCCNLKTANKTFYKTLFSCFFSQARALENTAKLSTASRNNARRKVRDVLQQVIICIFTYIMYRWRICFVFEGKRRYIINGTSFSVQDIGGGGGGGRVVAVMEEDIVSQVREKCFLAVCCSSVTIFECTCLPFCRPCTQLGRRRRTRPPFSPTTSPPSTPVSSDLGRTGFWSRPITTAAAPSMKRRRCHRLDLPPPSNLSPNSSNNNRCTTTSSRSISPSRRSRPLLTVRSTERGRPELRYRTDYAVGYCA